MKEKKGREKSNASLIFTLMAGYSMIYMDKNMISTAIIPIAKEFHLDAGQTGMIMSLFFLGYSLMQIPGGWLADKIGSKKVLILSLTIISIFSFAFGAVSSLMLFMMIRFFAGIGHAGYPPSCSKSIADNFAQERRTFIQSLILSTSGIGGILAFTIGVNLINNNWRHAYIFLGILFAIAALLVLLFVPNVENKPTKKEEKTIKFTEVISDKNVLILCLAMLLLNFMLYGNMSWLPSFLVQKFNLDITTIGYLLAVNAIFTTAASMFSGMLLSKVFLGKERLFIIFTTFVSAILILGFVLSNILVLSMILLFSISILSIGAFTAIFTWPHKIMSPSIIGSSIGVINTGGTLGGFLAPMILGKLINMAGGSFTLAFGFMAIASILCGLTILGVRKER